MNREKLKVMVIDDHPVSRQVLISLLHRIGFQDINEAENGQLAWNLLQNEKYDLILCDLSMPEMDGLELLWKIRENEFNNESDFIMVTAADDIETIRKAAQANVDSYIVKPFTKETLEKKISNVLKCE